MKEADAYELSVPPRLTDRAFRPECRVCARVMLA